MRAVEIPNLPVDAEAVIIGEKYREKLLDGLKKAGIRALWMPANPYLDIRLNAHADLSLLYAGGGTMISAPFLKDGKFEEQIKREGLRVIHPDIIQSPEYPHDSQLNICITGKKAVLNTKTVPTSIVKYLTNDMGLSTVDSRQGYSRCSICLVSEHAMITADKGLYKTLIEAGYEVLLITPGYIELDGFPYGFIGGASFKISSGKLAFTGALDAHPDKNSILSFLRSHDVAPVFLTDEPLFDIGSAIPITEK